MIAAIFGTSRWQRQVWRWPVRTPPTVEPKEPPALPQEGHRRAFVDAATVAEVFRHAPPLGCEAMRDELDRHVDQSIEPRG